MTGVIVTTTLETREQASALARSAVEHRLAACGRVSGPIVSEYWWEGKLDSAEEWLITFHSTESVSDRLIAFLKSNHPYDTPEISSVGVSSGNLDYWRWVEAETKNA